MTDDQLMTRRVEARLARTGLYGIVTDKLFDDKGVRLTDCCGAYSTHDMDGILVCKQCHIDVLMGEGDGNETKEAKETQ